MAETTPLLHDIGDTSHIDNDEEIYSHAEVKPASAYFTRVIKVFNITIIVLSAFTIATLIANIILANNAHSYYGAWGVRDASVKLIIVLSASIFFSFINVIADFPILLDVIVDVALVAFIIPRVIRLIDSIPRSYWCNHFPIGRPGIPPYPDYDNRQCERMKVPVTILMGIAAGFGGIIAAIYLVLLLLRGIAIVKTKYWKRLGSFPWVIPAGQISFEVSIKVLKQETTPAAGVAQAGPSGSGSQ